MARGGLISRVARPFVRREVPKKVPRGSISESQKARPEYSSEAVWNRRGPTDEDRRGVSIHRHGRRWRSATLLKAPVCNRSSSVNRKASTLHSSVDCISDMHRAASPLICTNELDGPSSGQAINAGKTEDPGEEKESRFLTTIHSGPRKTAGIAIIFSRKTHIPLVRKHD